MGRFSDPRHSLIINTMKTRMFIASIAVIMPLHAATHAVLPGISIQTKTNLAVAGDIVAIYGGTYNQYLTIDKAIRLVEIGGQEVTITGNIAFTGVTNCPTFEGFSVGSSGRGITITNTTGVVLHKLTGLTSSGVAATGDSTLEIADCNLTNISTRNTTTPTDASNNNIFLKR
jgi:nitrous oxidase accessory protein NosD